MWLPLCHLVHDPVAPAYRNATRLRCTVPVPVPAPPIADGGNQSKEGKIWN
jgi:hypothetical protein